MKVLADLIIDSTHIKLVSSATEDQEQKYFVFKTDMKTQEFRIKQISKEDVLPWFEAVDFLRKDFYNLK